MVVAVVVCFGGVARADTPAFQLNGAGNYPVASFTGTLGWEFNRYGYYGGGMYITQLGLFDNNGDGFSTPHKVGIWHEGLDAQGNSNVLLASATIPAGTSAPLVGGYRWVAIEPLWIPNNSAAYYMVGGQVFVGGADETMTPGTSLQFFTTKINPNTYWGYSAAGADMPYPAYSNRPSNPENPFGIPFWWANFQFSTIPEPASWQFVGTGLLLLLLRRRSIR